MLVVAAYGLLLPAWVLALPRLGCLNIHASLLPRWRGAAPIHRALEAGDAQTGVTIMQMDEGLDTGDMLLVEPLPITPDDTTGTLHDRLAGLGARLIVEALELAANTDYDAILMDLELPGMDGIEAARHLRSGRRNQDSPIIAVTAHAHTGQKGKCLAAGLNDCLTKPIAPAVLYQTLHRWTEGPSGQAAIPELPAQGMDLGRELPASLGRLAGVMDLPLALHRLDGQGELLMKFLKAFAEDPVDAESIRLIAAEGDRRRAAGQAHAIKGISTTLAITRVAEAAGELEHCLLDPTGDWQPVCDRLHLALKHFRSPLESLPGYPDLKS